ncbi:MAG TPA: FtsX-like permease family protein [Solirubrobacteraceae bacterium]|jgi:putative ABC transport system permease protein
MRLSGIRYIYEARLGSKAVLAQECFALLGIAVGVALLFASQVSSASLTRAVTQLNSQLIGNAQVQLMARGPEGMNAGLLQKAMRVPGVEIALPVLERQVNVIGPSGERSVDLIGIEPHAMRAGGVLLRRFSARQLSAQRAIALPAPLAQEIGAGALVAIKLQVGAKLEETLVGATLQASEIDELVHSPVALASLSYAQRLTGMPEKVSRIFVRYDPSRASEARAGLARLAAAAHANLVPGTFDSRLFAVAVSPESKSEQLFSGISALVGFMFALNAMLITVPSRRKLIADVRPHGATRWMTVQILLFDALVLGVLACGLGLVLGDVLSLAVFHSSPGYLAFAFPVGNSRIITWQSVALAAGAGMAAAIVGVLWPLHEIIGRPLQARSAFAHKRARSATQLGAGVLCLSFTTFTLFADTRIAVIGNVTLLLALVFLLPLLFDRLLSLFEWLSQALDGIGSALAITELRTPQTRVRSLAIAATAAVAVFGVVEFQGTQSDLNRGLDTSARQLDANADVWVIPRGRSSLQTTVAFEPQGRAHTLAALTGVGRVSAYRGSFFDWGARRLWVIAPPSSVQRPIPRSELLSGRMQLATARLRRGGWAVLSKALAEERHLHVGQTFTLPAPDPQTLRVAGLTTNLGWPPGAIILNAADYARGWPSGEPSAYMLDVEPGVSPAMVADLARRALAGTGLTAETAAQRARRHYALAAAGLARLTQIRILVLIASILAIVGAMAAMIWQRRGLISSMKCHGFREAVLWRWLLCESAVLLAAGSFIGAVFGLYAQLLGSHFLATVTGFPIVFSVEGVAAISSFALVTAIAVTMIAIPGYLAVRVPPRTVRPAY